MIQLICLIFSKLCDFCVQGTFLLINFLIFGAKTIFLLAESRNFVPSKKRF